MLKTSVSAGFKPLTIISYFTSRCYFGVHSYDVDPYLLWYWNLWWNWKRHEDHHLQSAGPHRRHHGPFHRLLHPQRGGDCLLCCQTIHVKEDLETATQEYLKYILHINYPELVLWFFNFFELMLPYLISLHRIFFCQSGNTCIVSKQLAPLFTIWKLSLNTYLEETNSEKQINILPLL